MDHPDDDVQWDYDCPQFVDFTVPMPFNDGADQMFESTIIGEGPSTTRFFSHAGGCISEEPKIDDVERKATDHLVPNEQKIDDNSQKAENGSDQIKCLVEKHEQIAVVEENAEKAPKKNKPGNLISSLEEWRKGKHLSSGQDEGPTTKKVKSISAKSVLVSSKSASALMRSKSVRTKSSSSTALLAAKPASRGSSPDLRTLRSHSRTLSQGRSNSTASLTSSSSGAESKGDTSKSSKPFKMPNLLKRLGEVVSTSSKGMSSEDMELERIRQLQKELKQKRQMAQQSYKKAMASLKPVMAPPTKDPTVPQQFNFHSDKRIKGTTEKVEETGVGDFVKSLRSRAVSPAHSSGPKKLTVPQPFHLTEKQSSGAPQVASKFVSMAETVTAFHRKTPERFRARARSGEGHQTRAGRSVSPKGLTQPHTPNLTSRGRNRPTHFLSQDQLEEMEIEEMKRNQFKAHPVNVKILNNPMTGVRKVPSKPVTQPEEFPLSSGIPRKKKDNQHEEEHYEFHANPINKKMLEGPMGVKPVEPALPTVPMSPAFALKHRVRLPVEIPEEKDTSNNTIKAKPVPHTGIPFQPKLPHQRTVPEPFIVEERSKAMLAQRDEKIRQVFQEEKRAREFRAQPLPRLDPDTLPDRPPKESTKPEPFHLETDERGALYWQELAHKVGKTQLQEEIEESRKASQFKAQPCTVINKDPFIPVKSTKPLTEVSDFELNLERRAVQRDDFEMHKKAREAELEGMRRQRDQREKEEEEAAIAKLRAELVHKPNPVRRYNPVIIKASDKPLTEAESPHFSERLRSNVRI